MNKEIMEEIQDDMNEAICEEIDAINNEIIEVMNEESSEGGETNELIEETKKELKKDFKFFSILFWATLQISAMTFGGGFVIIAYLKRTFVEKLGWLNENETIDLTAIAQCSPGAIAVNASFLIGYQLAGIAGAFVSVIATIIPPFVILSFISLIYNVVIDNIFVQFLMMGMQAGVAAVIVDIAVSLIKNLIKNKFLVAVITISAVFIAVTVFSVNLFVIIVICIVIGIVFCKGDIVGEEEG